MFGYSNNHVDVCGPAHKCSPGATKVTGAGNKSGCCTKDNPCPAGVGDCNADNQCEGDLKCSIHDKGNLYGYDNNHVDVCGPAHKCSAAVTAITGAGNKSGCCTKDDPCPAGVGDCNRDNECQGSLVCGSHDQGNKYGYSNNHVDVCIDAGVEMYAMGKHSKLHHFSV